MANQLGQASSASLMSLLRISVPLMISALSGNAMLFIDRVILANFSTEAMNSASAAGLAAFVFIFGAMSIASIGEVFVGQFNGAKQYKRLAIPVWQMLYFSMAVSVLYVPIALGAAHWIIPYSLHTSGIPYFQWLLCFGSLMPMIAALSGFFAGRGDVKIITYTAIVGNLVNLGLTTLLVFGWGPIQSLGVQGAAIATVLSQLLQVAILASVFLKQSHREQYNTHVPTWNKKVFIDCLKVGAPNAVGHTLEMAAWACLQTIVAGISLMHLTIMTLGQNLFILFGFLNDGMQKGVIAIASNLLGAGQGEKIKRLVWSAFKLQAIVAGLVAIPLLLLPEVFIQLFNVSAGPDGQEIVRESITSFKYVWMYILFDGLVWIFAGILTSGGDTKFIMWANALNVWLFAILPLYIVLNYVTQAPIVVWGITAMFAVLNFVAFYLRYQKGYWKKSLVVST